VLRPEKIEIMGLVLNQSLGEDGKGH
jgi:hypothetical protein